MRRAIQLRPTRSNVTATIVLFIALAASALAASAAEAFVYWTNFESGTIGRANLDGTGVDQSFIPGNYPQGVAVDGGHVYWTNTDWTNSAGDTIGRANLDGTAVDQSFITGASRPSGIAVDDSHIYWVNATSDSIGRAKLDGTGADQYFIFGVGRPSGPAVDGTHVYWANPYIVPFTIGRAELDGTGIAGSFISFPFGQFVEPTIPTAVAVDGDHLYWANLSDGSGGTIGRANLDGTGVDPAFITGAGNPVSVAVDDAHVYWGNGRTIGRASIDGTVVERFFIRDMELNSGTGVAVDALSSPPSNTFSFGRVKRNEKSGMAKLTVAVPGPGQLDLAKTNRVKADNEATEAAGQETLIVKSRGGAKKKLNSNGKAKVDAKVTFTPDGGEPNTERKRIKLIKR